LEELKKKFLGMREDEIVDKTVELPVVEKKTSWLRKIFRKKNYEAS